MANYLCVFWSSVFLSVVLVQGKTIFVSIPPEHATEIAAASLECIPKTGVQPDMLLRLVDWNFQESDRIKKFLYCFGTTSGYVDKEGHFYTDKMVKLVGNNRLKNQFENVLKECNKSVGENKYETLYKASLCFHDKTPILFKL
ncbi:uncharacterized protein LOC120634738 [Pararge aegeria]|uniref:Jg21537 protein n=1 Tax=Pararge aegeria aegeria TaxID=348720 RepID=A0A8S4RPT9_9NEOP|nr:uncharacterized protein LOC120634738 [Pararge aegeria]CAH2239533.1 jg21537 [Pararge aegeria aegeria]